MAFGHFHGLSITLAAKQGASLFIRSQIALETLGNKSLTETFSPPAVGDSDAGGQACPLPILAAPKALGKFPLEAEAGDATLSTAAFRNEFYMAILYIQTQNRTYLATYNGL